MITHGTRTTHVHFSKSAYARFRDCPQRYAYEKVERREPDVEDDPSPAALIGSAGHEAIAAILRADCDPATDERAADIGRAVLSEYALAPRRIEALVEPIVLAAQLAFARRGRIEYVESLVKMLRVPDATVWGKFDAVVVGGTAAPIEVIDWTFGRARASRSTDLLGDMGTMIYRLIAGDLFPNAAVRPIVVTQVAIAETLVPISIEMTNADVVNSWNQVKAAIDEIRLAIDTADFPPRPGNHCAFCPYRESCHASAPGSKLDEVPL
uniref:PD-(D/E)XK nuclease family protein n=1 Tax=Miltoncostaea marina TaxID=2843215 RepID=UPI001C3E3E78|nr:PD-(D/E)XK nuclease family protein [Miltoncostaea marina]